MHEWSQGERKELTRRLVGPSRMAAETWEVDWIGPSTIEVRSTADEQPERFYIDVHADSRRIDFADHRFDRLAV